MNYQPTNIFEYIQCFFLPFSFFETSFWDRNDKTIWKRKNYLSFFFQEFLTEMNIEITLFKIGVILKGPVDKVGSAVYTHTRKCKHRYTQPTHNAHKVYTEAKSGCFVKQNIWITMTKKFRSISTPNREPQRLPNITKQRREAIRH